MTPLKRCWEGPTWDSMFYNKTNWESPTWDCMLLIHSLTRNPYLWFNVSKNFYLTLCHPHLLFRSLLCTFPTNICWTLLTLCTFPTNIRWTLLTGDEGCLSYKRDKSPSLKFRKMGATLKSFIKKLIYKFIQHDAIT